VTPTGTAYAMPQKRATAKHRRHVENVNDDD
jgi:hypothetical protein